MTRVPHYGLLLRYGCAVASVAVAIWLRFRLDPIVGDPFPFATVFLAVLATAWYGGLWPALVAVALGAVASDFFLFEPRGTSAFDPNERFGLAIYLGTGLGIALLAGSMHSARRRSKSAAESSRHQAALIDLTYDAVFVWDWNGPIRFWNQGAERLYGYSRQEAIGRVSHDLLHTVASGGIETVIGALERWGSWEGELRHVDQDGYTLIVDSRMKLIREADRSYVLETNRDITARKQMEQSLQAANDLLESSVRG